MWRPPRRSFVKRSNANSAARGLSTLDGDAASHRAVRDTVGEWRLAWADALDGGFQIVCGFFFAEYVIRLAAAPGAPGAAHRGIWRARLAWAVSIGGVCDLAGALPGV